MKIFQAFIFVTIIVSALSSTAVISPGVHQLLPTRSSGEIISLLPYQDCLPFVVPAVGTPFKKESHGHGHGGHHDTPYLTTTTTQTFVPARYPSQNVIYPSLQGALYPSQGIVYPTQTVISDQPIYPLRPATTTITLPGSGIIADPNFFPYDVQKFEKVNVTQTQPIKVVEPIKIETVSNPLLGLENRPITLLDTLVAERELLNQKIEYLAAYNGPRETEKAH